MIVTVSASRAAQQIATIRERHGLAGEAAAWTVEELTQCLAEAGLTGLTWCRDPLLELHHAWWAPGRDGLPAPVEWTSPPMPPAARRTADRLIHGMTGSP